MMVRSKIIPLTDFDEQNIEGLNAHALDVDQSGDVHLFGQISWNRNEFVFPFTAGSTTTDTTTHYTLTTQQQLIVLWTYDDNTQKFMVIKQV